MRLESMILQVEKKNDGRFEVLTWSSALVIAIIAALLAINFFVSESKVKELVNNEIEIKTLDIRGKGNEILLEAQEIKKNIQIFADDAEKIFQTINDYNKEINDV